MSDTTIYYKCGGAGGGDNIKYLAPEFDTGTNYMQGSKVLKDNLLYKCKFDNTIGAWNESRWTQIYFADDTAEPPQDAVNFLSPKFVKNTDYKEGDVVEYGGLTYTFTEDYNGEWDITKVERKYICELNSNLVSNANIGNASLPNTSSNTKVTLGFKPRLLIGVITHFNSSNSKCNVWSFIYDQNVSTTSYKNSGLYVEQDLNKDVNFTDKSFSSANDGIVSIDNDGFTLSPPSGYWGKCIYYAFK